MGEHLGVGGGKRKNCKLQTNTEVRGKCEAGRKWGWGQGLQGSVGHSGVPGRRQSEERDRGHPGKYDHRPKGNREPSHSTARAGAARCTPAARNSLLKHAPLACF